MSLNGPGEDVSAFFVRRRSAPWAALGRALSFHRAKSGVNRERRTAQSSANVLASGGFGIWWPNPFALDRRASNVVDGTRSRKLGSEAAQRPSLEHFAGLPRNSMP